MRSGTGSMTLEQRRNMANAAAQMGQTSPLTALKGLFGGGGGDAYRAKMTERMGDVFARDEANPLAAGAAAMRRGKTLDRGSTTRRIVGMAIARQLRKTCGVLIPHQIYTKTRSKTGNSPRRLGGPVPLVDRSALRPV